MSPRRHEQTLKDEEFVITDCVNNDVLLVYNSRIIVVVIFLRDSTL